MNNIMSGSSTRGWCSIAIIGTKNASKNCDDNYAFVLVLEPNETIETVKNRINCKTRFLENVGEILICSGQILKDGHTITDFGIQSGSIIRTVRRWRSRWTN